MISKVLFNGIQITDANTVLVGVRNSAMSKIDMVDYACPEIGRTFYGRRTFYQSKEWPIQYLFCKDNMMKVVDEQVALDIIAGK